MPLLDIATAQAQPYLFSIRSQSLYHNHHAATFIIDNEFATARWRHYFSIRYKPQNVDCRWRQRQRRHCTGFVVKAGATIKPTHNGNLHLGFDSTANEDSADADDKEKANSGRRPWNYGLKHSPETLERIRERTRLAMKNTKIRRKLQTKGLHPQSKETRDKIGNIVRMAWPKRREKLMLQETCRSEWENLVAEASRKGFYGQEELQWNSYKILKEQIEQEWLDSVEQRKKSQRKRGPMSPEQRKKSQRKRGPMSPEQRKKISAAIAAKWADDPDYRNRALSGLTKYNGRVVKSRGKAPSDEEPCEQD